MRGLKIILLGIFWGNMMPFIYSQSDLTNNYNQVILNKSNTINCGKIDCIIKERCKESKNFTETHATLIFNNKNKKGFKPNECSYINLFFVEDSIQYIGNPKILVTIDHKRKKVQIDSTQNVCMRTRSLLSEFMAFYSNDLWLKWLEAPIPRQVPEKKAIPDRVTETDSSILFTLQCKKAMVMLNEEYQKKMEKEEKMEKNRDDPFSLLKYLYTQYTDVYEYRKSDTVLLRYSSKIIDVKPYREEAVVESKSYLIAADINNPEYQSLHYYNYLSYSENDYKTRISLSRETLRQMLDSTNNTSAPNFSLPVIRQNDTITLSNYKGKWVLLDFWFMACAPCRKLAPEIESIYKQYEPKGLKVFGISTDKNEENLKEFVRKAKHSYPMLSCYDTDVTSLYKVSFYPTVIVINPEQTIVFTGTGSSIAEQLRDFLNENLK